ncbi:MAG: trypsin-like peptidase domain-containing protein [Anaerolineae bacterium]|nr:trypsin-like peptidase domain-containing protein [Anaerolineae bacterium]
MSGSKQRVKVIVFGIVLVVVISLSLAASVSASTSSQTFQASIADAAAQVVDPATDLFTQLYEQVSPSVVAIQVTALGQNGRVLGEATGSGFVIDTEGHIVTNNHVVDRAGLIAVEFLDGTLAEAEIVGLDPNSDLAVLDVDVPAEQLRPISFGDSSALKVGQTVLAIGSPFGQDWTLTTGIVSGLNRVISGLTDFSIGGVIQTDAAINPGNSGGPLLNLDGQVVGVNSQILSESGSNSGVGFAVPSNLVQRVAAELVADGKVDYSYLGISGTDLTLYLNQSLDLPDNTRGVIVGEVNNGSPADEAGLQDARIPSRFNNATNLSYDIIQSINGVAVEGMDDIVGYLARQTRPGDTITVTILRNGTDRLDLTMTLMARPS